MLRITLVYTQVAIISPGVVFVWILFAWDRVHFVPGMMMCRLLSGRDVNLSVALEL